MPTPLSAAAFRRLSPTVFRELWARAVRRLVPFAVHRSLPCAVRPMSAPAVRPSLPSAIRPMSAPAVRPSLPSAIRRSTPGSLVATALALTLGLTAPTPPLAAQDTGPFARHPDVSPDGATVAFSFQGDIWTVPVEGGTARRLTIHEAYESSPRWSPDGTHIAFESNRFGSGDLFVMRADGTGQRRLTFHSAADGLGGWTPDGRLLFQTGRTYRQVEWEGEIYTVPVAGGTPDRLLDALGSDPSMSPDGRFVAFTYGSNGPERRRYRGPAAREIWLHDTQGGSYTEITSFAGNDVRPLWGGDRSLFYVSEADGTYNLYRLPIAESGEPASQPEQLTRFQGDGVRTFGVDADGSTLVLERRTDLYVLEPGASPRILEIRVPEAERFDPVERRTFNANASEFAVSPEGDYVAFVVRGEIFLRRNDEDGDAASRAVRLTDHPYRDRDVAWLSQEEVLFSTDRNGNYDLYLLRSADPQEPDLFRTLKREVVRLTDSPEEEHGPVVSPDRSQVAYLQGRGRLVVADVDDGRLTNQRTLQNGWATPSGVAWSPDSRWLAYSLEDLRFNAEIYIHPADGSSVPVNVSKHPKQDTDPVWSPDGSKLGFVSLRNNGDGDLWFAWLREEDWERTQRDWEELQEMEPEAPRQEPDTGAAEPVTVQIDREGIWKRLEQVTALPGNESDLAISPDGETFFFVNNRSGRQSFDADQDLHSIEWDGSGLTALTQGGQSPYGVRLGPEGSHLYMLRPGGRLARIQVGGGNLETLAFRARMVIHHHRERAQMFDEAWRVLNEGFYDPDFHGQDWEELREHYRPWALEASTAQDFQDVFNWMLGELNASHLGFRGPTPEETQREETGLLGVEIDPVPGGVRVERVIPGTPADREASRLEAGDVIVSVDGEAVRADENVYRHLTDRAGERTLLTVESPGGATREVVIRPTGSVRGQLYEEWVQDRKDLTERYSEGRVGYIHIQGMNWPSFERFERELVAAGEGKQGLVVDVRFNGGGWTTDYMMAVLMVRQHAYTIPRGAAATLDEHEEFRDYYPFGERLPLAAWTGPAVALCNANSFSNAEIFSHAFKTLDRGTLVGEPTFGAVISTGGAGLIDGSYVRLPFRAWYVKATDENMELGPAVPDIIIPTRPDYRAAGEDAQLEAAVRELLKEIDDEAVGGQEPAASQGVIPGPAPGGDPETAGGR